MNFGSNSALDLASEREDQERSAMVAEASAAVSKVGQNDCAGCGHPIPAARIAVAPFAVRCIGCQRVHEEEND